MEEKTQTSTTEASSTQMDERGQGSGVGETAETESSACPTSHPSLLYPPKPVQAGCLSPTLPLPPRQPHPALLQ